MANSKLYSDFLALDAQLKAQRKLILGHEFPKLPDKALFVTYVQSREDQRKIGIQDYLKGILELPLQDNSDICEFLSSNVIKDDSQIKVSKYRQGYLRKRGKNFGCWKKRYFILDGPRLKYYESEYGMHLGTIRLTDSQIGRQKPLSSEYINNVGGEPPFQHALLIIEPKKTAPGGMARHILCADSDRERDEWLEAMEQHIDYKASTKRLDQIKQKTNSNKVTTISTSLSPYLLPSNVNENRKKQRENKRRSSLPTLITNPNTLALLKRRHSDDYNNNNNNSTKFQPPKNNSNQSPDPSSSLFSSNENNYNDNSSSKTSPRSNTIPWFKNFFSSSVTLIPTKPSSLQQSMTGYSQNSKKYEEKTQVGDYSSSYGVPANSAPSTPTEPNQVFGIPLKDAVKVAKISESYELPAIVFRCIDFLETKNSILEEGIYRRSGNAAKVKALKVKFNKEGDVDLLADDEYHDTHVVSGLLKLWLRELPENILTNESLREMMNATDNISNRRKRTIEIGRIISLLPLPNYTLLRMLCAHLIRVIQNAGSNKMTLRNMGIVFSATLSIPTNIFSLLLTEFDDIFWTND
ncbi:Rho GTPase activation protein [Circinella umbellata]|nr:Rho GTPase activation protein [Circinella umbellata]